MNSRREITLSSLMQATQANHLGTIHGGEVMKIMDNAAGVLAMRYSGKNVVTARADQFQFLHPVHIASLVTCHARLAYVGRTSMEIFVTVDVEDLLSDDAPLRTTEAFFTLVAIDDNEKPTPVPPYTPETDLEKELYNKVKSIRDSQRKERNDKKGA